MGIMSHDRLTFLKSLKKCMSSRTGEDPYGTQAQKAGEAFY